jgi:hypothetical protein
MKNVELDYFTNVYKVLSKQFGIDTNIIKSICRSQFRYVNEIIHSDNKKDILINELFKFKVKRLYETGKAKHIGDRNKDWVRWNVDQLGTIAKEQ